MDGKTTYRYLSSQDNMPYRDTRIIYPDGSARLLLERANADGTYTAYPGEAWRIIEQSSLITKEMFDELVKGMGKK